MPLTSIFNLNDMRKLGHWIPYCRSNRSLNGWSMAMAFCLVVAPVIGRAQVWAYIDEQGNTHFATTQLHSKYQLFATAKVPVQSWLPAEQPELLSSTQATDNLKPTLGGPTLLAYNENKTYLQQISRKYGISYELLKAIAATESGFRSHVVSPKGAVGLMQVIPDTARRFGLKDQNKASIETQLKQPSTNLEIAAQYLNYLAKLYPHQLDLILASYNAGEGAVARYGHKIPPFKETQNYIKSIRNLLELFQKSTSNTSSQQPTDLFQSLGRTAGVRQEPSASNTNAMSMLAPSVVGGAKGRGNMMLSLPILPLSAGNDTSLGSELGTTARTASGTGTGTVLQVPAQAYTKVSLASSEKNTSSASTSSNHDSSGVAVPKVRIPPTQPIASSPDFSSDNFSLQLD